MLVQTLYDITPTSPLPALDATILRIVDLHEGIKDTVLTISVLSEIANDPMIKESTDPCLAAVMVAKAIHRLIHNGNLVAIDCETPKGSFTYILPGGSRAIIAMPVFVIDNRTRH